MLMGLIYEINYYTIYSKSCTNIFRSMHFVFELTEFYLVIIIVSTHALYTLPVGCVLYDLF